ncbi:MAG: SHOCT domain-containing protein [Nanoarchaeota archaeon]
MVYGCDFGYGMMDYYPFGGSMMLFWIIFWVIVIYVIYKLLSQNTNWFNGSSLEVLKKRYAKGEITKKQFDQMKKDLK